MALEARRLALLVVTGLPLLVAAPGAAQAQRAAQTNAERDAARIATTIPFREGAPPIAGLPQPLAEGTATRLRRIFDMQSRGDDEGAARELGRLGDRRLTGHVLAHRWTRHGAERPSVEDLQAWLRRYGDHPDAPALHAMLVRASGPDDTIPRAPGDRSLSPTAEQDASPNAASGGRTAGIDGAQYRRAANGEARAVAAEIARARNATPTQVAQRQAAVALAAFRAGRDADAFDVASAAAAGEPTGRAAYAAGLSAWALGRIDAAMPYFEAAARAEEASHAQRGAAAYWTARAAVRTRRPELYVPWMLQAANVPGSFYGQVARRALGLDAGFHDGRGTAAEEDASLVAGIAGGWRALALLQVGQRERAEAELRRLWPRAEQNPALLRALHAVAGHAGLTHLTSQLAARRPGAEARAGSLAARVPMPRLAPEGGFRVDPALLYALTRQESNFQADAISTAGARGLMQLMPDTASYVANDPTLAGDAIDRLHEPGLSLELGQRYLLMLARQQGMEGDLIRILAAYNAGPGNVMRWQPPTGHRDDPFLYIESIPFDETREYVQRVLVFSWAYAARLSFPTPSLDALAAGTFPRFASTQDILVMLRRGEARR
ncbi:MAG: lytic transglycosylase domain-containing protein [Pseudomonadota bacterium]